MPRFSIRWLLVSVLLIGVAFVALFKANSYWVKTLENIAIVLLLSALAGSFCLSSSRRAFSGGFFIFGLFYFLTATDFFGFSRAERLLPTAGLQALHANMFEAKTEAIPKGVYLEEADTLSSTPLPDGSRQGLVVRPRPRILCARW